MVTGGSLVPVSSYPFLSPDWIAAARELRDEFADQIPTPTEHVRANLVITDAPFADEHIEGHIDTTSGAISIDEGHVAEPELTVTTDYDTAKTLFVDRDPAKAMEAFMLGKILVTGDVAKMMTFAGAPPPTDADQIELANQIASRLAAITDS